MEDDSDLDNNETIANDEKNNPEMIEEQYIIPLAKAYHASVSAMYVINGKEPLVPWFDLPQVVQDAWKLLAGAVYNDPSISPQALHNLWIDYKQNQGWELGEKDFDNKKTPLLLPYDDLDPVYQYRYQVCICITPILLNKGQPLKVDVDVVSDDDDDDSQESLSFIHELKQIQK